MLRNPGNQFDCFGNGDRHNEHRGTRNSLPASVPSDSSSREIPTSSTLAYGMPETTTGNIYNNLEATASSTVASGMPGTTTGNIFSSRETHPSSTAASGMPETTTGSIHGNREATTRSTVGSGMPGTTTGNILSSREIPTSSTAASSMPETTTGQIRASTTTPNILQQEDVRTCKHDLSGRLRRIARNFKDDLAATAGLMLVDAFLHPSNHFAYVLFKRQSPQANGFVTGQDQLRFARNVTFNCLWVSPENPKRLLHVASDSSWQNSTYKGRVDDVYELVMAKCDAGNVATGLLQKPLPMNITATAAGKILARWENAMVCHEPLSQTPIRSLVCTSTLRNGTNPHSGAIYEPKSMDRYIKNWVEYSLRIGFDMVLMYFEDQDLSPIEEMLRPYIDSHKLVLVRSYFHGITGYGWSPLLPMQESGL